MRALFHSVVCTLAECLNRLIAKAVTGLGWSRVDLRRYRRTFKEIDDGRDIGDKGHRHFFQMKIAKDIQKQAADGTMRSDFKPAREKRTVQFASKEKVADAHKVVRKEYATAFEILAR